MTAFQVMASNDLRTGRVVYLTGAGHWSADFQLALRLDDEEAVLDAERCSASAVDENQVVDPYLVKIAASTAAPSHIRERIRHSGPTCLAGLDEIDGSLQSVAG